MQRVDRLAHIRTAEDEFGRQADRHPRRHRWNRFRRRELGGQRLRRRAEQQRDRVDRLRDLLLVVRDRRLG